MTVHIWLGRVVVLAVACLLVASPPGHAQQQSQIPETPAGKVLAAWLTALNSGAPDANIAFETSHRTGTPSIYQAMFLRATTGGFTVVRIERNEPLSITALLQEKYTEQLDRVELVVDTGTPTKIVKHQVRAVSRPPDLAIPRQTETEALSALTERANAAAAADEFSGVLLVARGNRVLLERSWGHANRDTQAPVTADTRFDIASTGKMFTAVATLQLVEAGKLRLDDPVAKHILDYANKDFASKVTIRHLLTHTGGAGGLPNTDVRATLRNHQDYVQALADRAPAFEPGTDYQYSNHGYVLLGAIVERASGMSYADYVRVRILEPAGMSSTALRPTEELNRTRAHGYTRRNDTLVPTGGWILKSGEVSGWVPGQAYSTARDLLRFAQALESGKLISKAMLTEAITPRQDRRYVYGFLVRDDGTTRNYGHGGSGAGANSDVRIFPNLGMVVIGISNFDQPAAERLVDFYINRMPIN